MIQYMQIFHFGFRIFVLVERLRNIPMKKKTVQVEMR